MSDVELMGLAIEQARRGLKAGAMPIGAVLTHRGEVLAEAHWRGSMAGLLAHPEHLVLLQADASIEWRVRREAVLYTTSRTMSVVHGGCDVVLSGKGRLRDGRSRRRRG